MKRFIVILLPAAVAFFALTAAAIQTSEACDAKELKAQAKKALDPFTYDSGKITKIMYKPKTQLKEIEVPVFIGEKYRMVFNTEGLSRNVVINIYNKDKESKDRKPIFTTKQAPAAQRIHVFEPQQAKFKFYVDYEIPAADSASPECLVFMLGYK
ncbi:MAG: hypothetical protein ACRCYO_08555 [Bacteroidia bacterium]